MNLPQPIPRAQRGSATQHSTLNTQHSFGFGDLLGLATPGHLAAGRGSDFTPFFAQASVRDLAAAQRSPADVLHTAQLALADGGFDGTWGAEADGLRTPEDVEPFAAAGFTRFTLDPSENIVNRAATLSPAELAEAATLLAEDGIFLPGWMDAYLDRASEDCFTPDALQRAAVKYGWALAQVESLAAAVARSCGARAFELEVDFTGSFTPTTPGEHLFLAHELRRRGVPVAALALRLPGEWELAVDFAGDAEECERALAAHAAIAKTAGPHQLSFPRCGDKFSILPALGRQCGELLHVKTSGTSWLEALRVVARVEPRLFRELLMFCQQQFIFDRTDRAISTTEDDVRFLPDVSDGEMERVFLGERQGRQMLHVTAGSVLSGFDPAGHPWREALRALLTTHADLHAALLAAHLGRHLDCLRAG